MIAAALQNKKVSVPHDFIVNSKLGVPGTKRRSKGHQNEEGECRGYDCYME